MPRRTSRGLLPRQINIPVRRRIPLLRPPRIAEVFEDLATESIVELVVYENFLDLNPQVRRFPNLSPEERIPGQKGDNNTESTANRTTTRDNDRINGKRTNRRGLLRNFRLR
ncbi:MAG: hypothetical protein ACOCRL_02155 [Bacillota bacterium]